MQNTLANSRSQPRLGHDVNTALKQFFEVHQRAAQIEETASRFQIDKNVNIALCIIFATGGGAEDAEIVCTVARSDTDDFISLVVDDFGMLGVCSTLPHSFPEPLNERRLIKRMMGL